MDIKKYESKISPETFYYNIAYHIDKNNNKEELKDIIRELIFRNIEEWKNSDQSLSQKK